MKKILLLTAIAVLIPFTALAQLSDLIISEYGEGSSNNKYVEIYNGTGNTVDLSNYELWRVSNGGTWPEATLSLSGNLSDGETYVIANSSADVAITSIADITDGIASWNGDDAVGLAKNGTLIDAIGEDGADPGNGWDVAGVTNATQNHTLRRKESVTGPTTDWNDSRGTDADNSQWIVDPQDTWSDIGRAFVEVGELALKQVGTYQSGVFDEGAAEIIAHDPTLQRLFVINSDAGTVDILDFSDPSNMTKIGTLDIASNVSINVDGINSVAVSNGLVAVAVEADGTGNNGVVAVYKTNGTFEFEAPAGALPDMVTFTPDGSKILVANEGEPNDDYTIDPEGSITIVDVASENSTQLTFNAFDAQKASLISSGVRIFGGGIPYSVTSFNAENDNDADSVTVSDASAFNVGDMITIDSDNTDDEVDYVRPYQVAEVSGNTLILTSEFDVDLDGGVFEEGTDITVDPNNPTSWTVYHNIGSSTVSQDLEPEYIAVNDEGTKAWVSLQENNAVAEIDIVNETITAVLPLGYKDHNQSGNGFDGSKDDGVVNIQPWPTKGMYQPDAIASVNIGGNTYYLTANEGDAREYDAFIEEVDLDFFQMGGSLDNNLRDDDNLGDLVITSTLGITNGDTELEEIYSFGARSFSIWDDAGNQIFDSGDDFEKITAQRYPNDFNSNNDENNSFDDRSDNKGPEPEAVAVAKIKDKVFAFIGLERMGGIMIYDITDPANAGFVDYVNNRDYTVDVEANLLAAGDLGPEDIKFVKGDDSPDGCPLVLVANEVSGSVTVYAIESTLFEDDFQDMTFEPWTEYSVASNRDWILDDFRGNYYMEANGFSGDVASDDWLISPAIDTRKFKNIVLNFDHTQRFDGGNLELYASTDYEGQGDPNNANWTQIPFDVDDATFTYAFVNSGDLDVSQFNSRTTYFAYKYTSSGTGPGQASLFQIDNFSLKGNEILREPTQIVVAGTRPTTPLANVNFELIIEAQDASGVPQEVASNTQFTLQLNQGSGNLSGTLNGMINAGESEAVVMVSYDEAGKIKIDVSEDSNELTATTSEYIDILTGPEALTITELYNKGHVGAEHPDFMVEAVNADGNVNTNFTGFEVTVEVYDGGTMVNTFTSTAVNGIASFENEVFNTAGNLRLVANSSGLESDNNFVEVLDIPNFTELIIPQFMIGNAGDGNFGGRLPVYALVEISGLHPNTEYRYNASMDNEDFSNDLEELQTETTVGNNIHYSEEENDFWHVDDRSIDWEPSRCDSIFPYKERPYSTFSSNAAGTAKVWINQYTSSNYRFDINNNEDLWWIFTLGNERGGQVRVYQTENFTKPLVLDNNPGNEQVEATGIVDINSLLESKTILVFYGNDNTGRPISSTIVQGDGSILQSTQFFDEEECEAETWFPHQGAPFYRDIDGYIQVDNQFGGPGEAVATIPEVPRSWAAFIPNIITTYTNDVQPTSVPSNPNETFASSINRIEQYDLKGNPIMTWTDDDGIWAGVNTNDPDSGIIPIPFETPGIELTNIFSTDYCNDQNGFDIRWRSHGVQEVNIYIINDEVEELLFSNVNAENEDDGVGSVVWYPAYGNYDERDLQIKIESVEHNYVNETSPVFQLFDRPVIIDQTVSSVTCVGDTVSLFVIAQGSSLEFQWYKDGIALPGEDESIITILDAEYSNSGDYTVRISNANSNACSPEVSEIIPVYVAQPTEVYRNPQDKGATIGDNTFFTFEVHGNGIPDDYRFEIQWYRDSIPLEESDRYTGVNSNILTIRDVQQEDFAQNAYYAVINALCGTVTTESASLEETDIIFGANLADAAEGCEGDDVTLRVNASANNGSDIEYQWYKDMQPLANDGTYNGVNTSTLSLSDIDETQEGDYYVDVQLAGDDLVVSSNMLTMTVSAAPEFTQELNTEVTVTEEDTVTFEVTIDGDYENVKWLFNGVEFDNDELSYTINSVELDQSGTYEVVVSNSCGEIRSTTELKVEEKQVISSVTEITTGSQLVIFNPMPNPAEDFVSFEAFAPEAGNYDVSIVNQQGKVLLTLTKMLSNGMNNVELDLTGNNLPNGSYFIQLTNNENTATQKLIIQK